MARPFEGKTFTCEQCGKSFRRSRSEIARGRTKFCTKSCSGISHRGEKNPAYKRGWHISDNGYKKIRVGRAYKFEHRYVMEQSIGRNLGKNEDVHHKDHNKLNNDVSNLEILTKAEHAKSHGNWLGEKNHTTKLNKSSVLDIRRLHASGVKASDLASRYSVDVSNIRYIVNRVTWKHV